MAMEFLKESVAIGYSDKILTREVDEYKKKVICTLHFIKLHLFSELLCSKLDGREFFKQFSLNSDRKRSQL